ncbi:ATP-dependent DNA helicase RecG [Brevirhabdus sp.]|uniref:ATP-dependent DNA helicase RecG n=1 Tax=Brevirhabdus sp. TaxID=2004514 RepID=UPI004059EE59
MKGRPPVLFPLFAGLETLDGIGPKTAAHFAGLDVARPRDLLFVLPNAVVDRRLRDTIADVAAPAVVTVEVTVGQHQPPRTRGKPYRVVVSDAQASFTVVFFHARGDYVEKLLPTGQRRVLSGKLEHFDGLAQMVHPDHVLRPEAAGELAPFEPVYPLSAGLSQKSVAKAVNSALKRLPELEEWIAPSQMRKAAWPVWAEAVRRAHRPGGPDDVAADDPARLRLAYDELFAHQLTLALARAHRRALPGLASVPTARLQGRVLDNLPYRATAAQLRAIEEVNADLARPQRMNRLLQGDVGAGKTLVALMALLAAVEAGGQGVLMAPTEILARQHMAGLQPLAEEAGVVIALLTGRDKGSERRAKLAAVASGDIQLLVGTHAVFQKDVVFRDLRLAVVDEQHRFGVRQRMDLGAKGRAVDVLVMTATPIPRSLALAQYGDMDVSVLDEKPPGRTPVKTALVGISRLSEVVDHLRRAVAEGRQAYWVCPLVDESDTSDLTAAEARFRMLEAALHPIPVGLVHGQLPPKDKDRAMADFARGDTKVLVATTVIEVGVDVPNASIMVIERAEIFGMAQLHQLRGRVGRGSTASTCLLLYQAPLNDTAMRRLTVLRDTEDGFRIAEEDLAIRGAGDLIGTAQSGLPRFRIADLERDTKLLSVAQSDARSLLYEDPELTGPRGRAARVLLWLMEQDKAIRLISVG